MKALHLSALAAFTTLISAPPARADDPPQKNDPAFDFKKPGEDEEPASPPSDAPPPAPPAPPAPPTLPIDSDAPEAAPAPPPPPPVAPAAAPAPQPKAAAAAPKTPPKAAPARAKAKKRRASKREVIPPGSPIAGVPAFRVLEDGSSRIFLKITGKPTVSERKSASAFGLVLPGVYVPTRIAQRPLDTSFFATPVSRVRLIGEEGSALLAVDMKQPAVPTLKIENQSDGIVILIDFPKPTP